MKNCLWLLSALRPDEIQTALNKCLDVYVRVCSGVQSANVTLVIIAVK